jgi:hypothetical protein
VGLGATGGGITATYCDARTGVERRGEDYDRAWPSHGFRGTEDNVRDEFEEATRRGQPEEDATREAVEEEERTGGTGGTKDNVQDEWDETQRR